MPVLRLEADEEAVREVDKEVDKEVAGEVDKEVAGEVDKEADEEVNEASKLPPFMNQSASYDGINNYCSLSNDFLAVDDMMVIVIVKC